MTRPDAPAPDPLGIVAGAMGFGAALGVGLQALVTFGVRSLQAGVPAVPAAPSLSSAPALLLLVGTFAGMVGAGLATWTLLAPIGNPWRQAMLALVAGFGSFVLSLVTLPIDRAFGRSGLLLLALVAAGLCAVIGRRLTSARQRS